MIDIDVIAGGGTKRFVSELSGEEGTYHLTARLFHEQKLTSSKLTTCYVTLLESEPASRRWRAAVCVGSLPWCFLLAYVGVALGPHWEDIMGPFRYLDIAVIVGVPAHITFT